MGNATSICVAIRRSDRLGRGSGSNSISGLSGGSEQIGERVNVRGVGVADDDKAQAGLGPRLHAEASLAARSHGCGQ